MKIGLTYTGSELKHNNYVNWIRGNDAIEVVTLSAGLNNLDAVAGCDGIVLSGGIDMNPSFYGGPGEYANAPEQFDSGRDAFELAVFKETQDKNIPVLGICRGLQLINCFYEGSMQQDLAEKNTVHKITDAADKVHGIHIVPGTLIHTITGNEYAAVNSAHHQAIGALGKGLKITASSEDGVPEALERIDPDNAPFLLCVQWHPERMYKFGLEGTSPSKELRNIFLEAINKK